MLTWNLIFLSGFIFSKGQFSYPGVFLLLVCILLIPFLIHFKNLPKIDPKILLCIICTFSIVVYGGFYQSNYVFISLSLLSLSLLLSYLLILLQKSSLVRWVYISLFSVAVATRLLMIWSSPNPHIDVFDFLKGGAQGFLKGVNPYSNTYTPLYKGEEPNYYSYPPGALFLTMPSVFLFNDPRYMILAAELITAFVIFKLIRFGPNKFIYPLIFLFNPVSLIVLEQSFTEPLILVLIALSIFYLARSKIQIAAILFGLVLATKQYTILFLPLYIRLFPAFKQKVNSLVILISTVLILILPFYLWSPNDFLQDLILYNFNAPQRSWSLSFTSFLYNLGININFYFFNVLIAILSFFLYLQKDITLAKFLYLCSFLIFVFFFFNKWSSLNYYYLIGQLFFLGFIVENSQIIKK